MAKAESDDRPEEPARRMPWDPRTTWRPPTAADAAWFLGGQAAPRAADSAPRRPEDA